MEKKSNEQKYSKKSPKSASGSPKSNSPLNFFKLSSSPKSKKEKKSGENLTNEKESMSALSLELILNPENMARYKETMAYQSLYSKTQDRILKLENQNKFLTSSECTEIYSWLSCQPINRFKQVFLAFLSHELIEKYFAPAYEKFPSVEHYAEIIEYLGSSIEYLMRIDINYLAELCGIQILEDISPDKVIFIEGQINVCCAERLGFSRLPKSLQTILIKHFSVDELNQYDQLIRAISVEKIKLHELVKKNEVEKIRLLNDFPSHIAVQDIIEKFKKFQIPNEITILVEMLKKMQSNIKSDTDQSLIYITKAPIEALIVGLTDLQNDHDNDRVALQSKSICREINCHIAELMIPNKITMYSLQELMNLFAEYNYSNQAISLKNCYKDYQYLDLKDPEKRKCVFFDDVDLIKIINLYSITRLAFLVEEIQDYIIRNNLKLKELRKTEGENSPAVPIALDDLSLEEESIYDGLEESNSEEKQEMKL